MRYVFVFFLLLGFAYSNEIQRIEDIIKDISKLRLENERCKEELSGSDKLLEENIKLQKRVDELEEIVKKQKILLKTKEKTEKKPFVQSEKCEKETPFPALIMKEEHKETSDEKSMIVTFKASAFRLKTDSIIYDAPNGENIDLWEKGTSFTSSSMMDGWIRISGYFVKRKWRKAQKEMWVKSAQTIKR